MTQSHFVKSKFERLENDNYQTLDARCVKALVERLSVPYDMSYIDCCAPNGSGIVTHLTSLGFNARGVPDAFADEIVGDWIVSNPPYKRNIVDKIIYRQLQRIVDNQVGTVAMLLRTGFDHAKTRYPMFGGNHRYCGQLKMLFRPKWFEDGDKTPIHNYVWHLWDKNWNKPPQVWYV